MARTPRPAKARQRWQQCRYCLCALCQPAPLDLQSKAEFDAVVEALRLRVLPAAGTPTPPG